MFSWSIHGQFNHEELGIMVNCGQLKGCFQKGMKSPQSLDGSGAPETIRTSDRLNRNQVLYPAELRVRKKEY